MAAMKLVGRAVVLAAVTVVAVVVPVEPASASVSVSASLTVPIATAVGQTGVAGSFTVVNINTPPNQAESNTITQLGLTLSCGAVGTSANPCPTPDLGVYQIAPTATGAAGTACAGVTFSVSAPNASGTVTFAPVAPVVLAPPGGAAGSDRCTVNFTFSVLKVPAIDVNPGAVGVQTRSSLRAQVMAAGGLTVATFPSVEVTVSRAQPQMTTQASPSVPLGAPISDTATLSGPAGIAAPTGTVTFSVFGPNNATCAGVPVATSTNPIAAGTAQSDPFVVAAPGVYRFIASYSGDANYTSRTSTCNDAGESVTVLPRRAVADFDGDGKTDLALFRPPNGFWFLRGASDSSTPFGTAGDLAVPADYDGDGRADLAVYRPSSGVWFIRRSSGGDQARPWGTSTDVPVPGDYDGDGLADLGVFRPASGLWLIRRATGVNTFTAFGLSSDIPVPGDYDADGKTDIAVYRPSTGVWFVQRSSGGTTVVAWGTGGDIPVPGDYDGDARTDLAVFRPSAGLWLVNRSSGGTTVQAWGTSGDIPVPGDYDGDGKTDLAVFRPASGLWFVNGSGGLVLSAPWGTSGDVPVALPAAIRASLPPPNA